MNTETSNKNPFFSVIIPTRNRPELFSKSLQSVIDQDFSNYEIIIIDDGSSETNQKKYIKIISSYNKSHIKFIPLIFRPNGHYHSFTRNYGVELAKGKYICFLDDDDIWTNSKHLYSAYKSITNQAKAVDLYLTNQIAVNQDGVIVNNVWIEDLQKKILYKLKADKTGTYSLSTQQLLLSDGFCHLNCTIYLRSFFLSIEGMDENYRYEPDRDIYIRAIDQSKMTLHNPTIIGKHYIPDKNKKINASTQLSSINKHLYQLRTFDKAILFAHQEIIRNYCKLHKSYVLKNISMHLYENKKYSLSYIYAKEALAVKPNIKWLSFTLFIMINKLISTEKPNHNQKKGNTIPAFQKTIYSKRINPYSHAKSYVGKP